ncbi:MAG: M91 family zinc metallopeptidase, partial [Pyrinomonadaceae bacterium]
IKGDVAEEYKGKLSTKVSAAGELNAQTITLEALTGITLKVGASFISLDLTGITIQGPIVKINSGGMATGTSPFKMADPLDAEHADTGEPGYCDRPRRGGGGGGRRWRTVDGYHGPVAERDANGVYHVGNIAINQGARNPNFQRDVLNDLAIIGTTPTGQQTLDNIQNNPNGNQVTIVERNNPADPTNGGATAANPTNAGNGTGSNSTIDYDPTVYPVSNATDSRSQHNAPSDALLHHELAHADHHTNGTRDGTPRTDCFTTNEEFNTIGNPGGPQPDNSYRRERGIEERNNHKDY